MGVRIGNGCYLHRIIRTGQDLPAYSPACSSSAAAWSRALSIGSKGLVVRSCSLCPFGVSAGAAVRRRGAIWHIAAVSTVVAADHVVVGIRIGGGGVICRSVRRRACSARGNAAPTMTRRCVRQQPFLIMCLGLIWRCRPEAFFSTCSHNAIASGRVAAGRRSPRLREVICPSGQAAAVSRLLPPFTDDPFFIIVGVLT